MARLVDQRLRRFLRTTATLLTLAASGLVMAQGAPV